MKKVESDASDDGTSSSTSRDRHSQRQRQAPRLPDVSSGPLSSGLQLEVPLLHNGGSVFLLIFLEVPPQSCPEMCLLVDSRSNQVDRQD